ncbi:MAG: ribonuclease III [Spirochaetes bacterium]|nr:ribonuclease III [Spirochaetota bacterium]MBN2770457.1 ribonuclease III [Spirochaetota bacterium]
MHDFKNRSKDLNRLQKILKVKFTNLDLLNRSLTHRSYANELPYPVKENERLEYLGDSVLGLVINEYLYKRFESYHEGDLAKIKSTVVSEEMLAAVAFELKIGQFILLGKGEENSGGRSRLSILANTVEAIIGAMYLDRGLKASKKFILSVFKKYIDQVDKIPTMRDPKTSLQEIVQKKYKKKPDYILLKEEGPDHEKLFTVALTINGRVVIEGSGTSKRRAEVDAARKILNKIKNERFEV